MSKINFVRASLTKTQYSTSFINKTKKKRLNNASELKYYVLTTKETPIECITAEQDFNYFLAKGCRKELKIDNCQLGFPFSGSFFSFFTLCSHSGNISYLVKPGTVIRSGGEFYLEFVDVQPFFGSNTYIADFDEILNVNYSNTYIIT